MRPRQSSSYWSSRRRATRSPSRFVRTTFRRPVCTLVTSAVADVSTLVMAALSGSIAEPVAFSIYLGMLFLSSRFLYRRRVAAFVESWQRARGWALEGRRMRNELDQARRIQLSMLPQSDPYSDWLDIAGTSRP